MDEMSTPLLRNDNSTSAQILLITQNDAENSETFKSQTASSMFSVSLATIEKGLKINLFLCSFHISAKIICTKKCSAGIFIAEFSFLRIFRFDLSFWQSKHHKLSCNSRPSSTLAHCFTRIILAFSHSNASMVSGILLLFAFKFLMTFLKDGRSF